MIGGPLAARWIYDLGHRKIFEFRSALGLDAEGPAPASAIFAYAVVPGLARILTDPQVAAQRPDLRLARLEAVFASELDMCGRLMCASDVRLERDVVGVITCEDERGARVVVTVHLAADDGDPRPPVLPVAPLARIELDRGKSIAFAAATWDLNPAYWDRELAEAAGLGDVVAPPGLPLALALEHLAGPPAAIDVRFVGAARSGETLDLRVQREGSRARFTVDGSAGSILHGETVFHPG